MLPRLVGQVSRGGLRGLVPGLAAHLIAKNPAERMAAAYLIADAADYVLKPLTALTFGGRVRPERRLVPGVVVGRLGRDTPEGSTVDQAREGDRVECSVFAPPTVSRGSTVLIQAFAHISSQGSRSERQAMSSMRTPSRRAVKNY